MRLVMLLCILLRAAKAETLPQFVCRGRRGAPGRSASKKNSIAVRDVRTAALKARDFRVPSRPGLYRRKRGDFTSKPGRKCHAVLLRPARTLAVAIKCQHQTLGEPA